MEISVHQAKAFLVHQRASANVECILQLAHCALIKLRNSNLQCSSNARKHMCLRMNKMINATPLVTERENRSCPGTSLLPSPLSEGKPNSFVGFLAIELKN